MSNIAIIDERQVLGKEFRIYGTTENPLFLAKDVAEWIEYDVNKVGQLLKNVDEDEKIISPIYYSGQVRNMYLLTEDGLYEVLMQSRKPIAKQFKKQVKQILKQIRQTGGYIPVKESDTNEEFLARALLITLWKRCGYNVNNLGIDLIQVSFRYLKIFIRYYFDT